MKKKKNFWDTQYKKPTHLALSDEPAEDLVKFTRWLEREQGRKFLNVTAEALDLGCGNGRNLIYLAETYGMRGVGYDSSTEAIRQAQQAATATINRSGGMSRLMFAVRNLTDPIPLQNESATLVLDMMSSHVLLRKEREFLRSEILRTLRPNGFLFFKSFLLDGDQHAERLLKEHPADEEGMYIHPEIGVAEYVWTESALQEFFAAPAEAPGEGGNRFIIHKIDKSHKHLHKDKTAWKRRTVSVYLEKI